MTFSIPSSRKTRNMRLAVALGIPAVLEPIPITGSGAFPAPPCRMQGVTTKTCPMAHRGGTTWVARTTSCPGCERQRATSERWLSPLVRLWRTPITSNRGHPCCVAPVARRGEVNLPTSEIMRRGAARRARVGLGILSRQCSCRVEACLSRVGRHLMPPKDNVTSEPVPVFRSADRRMAIFSTEHMNHPLLGNTSYYNCWQGSVDWRALWPQRKARKS